MIRTEVREVTNVEDLPLLLTVEEVGCLLLYKEAWVREMIKKLQIPAFKIGFHWRIHRDDFIAFMESRKANKVRSKHQNLVTLRKLKSE